MESEREKLELISSLNARKKEKERKKEIITDDIVNRAKNYFILLENVSETSM